MKTNPKEYTEGFETFTRWAGNPAKLAEVAAGPYPTGSDASQDWQNGFDTAKTNEEFNLSIFGQFVNISQKDTTDPENAIELRRVPPYRIKESEVGDRIAAWLIDFAKKPGFDYVEFGFGSITFRVELWKEEAPAVKPEPFKTFADAPEELKRSGPYTIYCPHRGFLMSLLSDSILWGATELEGARFTEQQAEGLIRFSLSRRLDCSPSSFEVEPATFARVTALRFDKSQYKGNKGFGTVGYVRDGDTPADTVWFHIASPVGVDPREWEKEARAIYKVGARLTEEDV